MLLVLRALVAALRALLRPRAALVLENLALRQQLAVLKRTAPRPRLRQLDRVFWVVLSSLWSRWRDLLVVVKPETVVAWHRAGFRLYWRWRSRRRGRPPIAADVIAVIRRMATENTGWGAPRIQAELKLLGHDVAESTVAKYIPQRRRDGTPSQSWRTFLKNHISKSAACDFFAVPTATFRMLFCFVILSHDRRKIVHFNVTSAPTAEWTARQLAAAFPGDGTEPKYLLRDRDSIYDERFRRQVKAMGIEEVVSAPRSPWQNPFAERVIGTLRRDCLDHVIVLGERHLLAILRKYVSYYHEARPHSSLDGNLPIPREVEPPPNGRVVAEPVLGGLHHRYRRAA
jgi:transposase InsO family protein